MLVPCRLLFYCQKVFPENEIVSQPGWKEEMLSFFLSFFLSFPSPFPDLIIFLFFLKRNERERERENEKEEEEEEISCSAREMIFNFRPHKIFPNIFQAADLAKLSCCCWLVGRHRTRVRVRTALYPRPLP